MKLGEQLKENGIKQKWLADKLGVHPNQVSRWVKGKNKPSTKNRLKINKLIRSISRRGVGWNLTE